MTFYIFLAVLARLITSAHTFYPVFEYASDSDLWFLDRLNNVGIWYSNDTHESDLVLLICQTFLPVAF